MLKIGTLVRDQQYGDLGIVVPIPEFMRNAFGSNDVFVAWIGYTSANIAKEGDLENFGLLENHSTLPRTQFPGFYLKKNFDYVRFKPD